MQLKIFVFNPFSVNTYLVWDATKQAIIIDCTFSNPNEKKILLDSIKANELEVKLLLNTHCHFDHIVGIKEMKELFPDAKYMAHKEERVIIDSTPDFVKMLGFEMGETVYPDEYVVDNQLIKVGDFEIKVIHTPGHTAGGVCYYIPSMQYLFSGDTLFRGGIGRTDLETGNYESIINSIKTKLMVLPIETKIYPGHGDSSNIGYEINNNPFL